MSAVHVSSFALTREPAVVDQPRVRVSSFSLTVTPPAPPPPRVYVSHFSVTVGFETPVGDGGLFRRLNDTWVQYELLPRLSE